MRSAGIHHTVAVGGSRGRSLARVRSVGYNHVKTLRFARGNSISLHRFACVGPGDLVDLRRGQRHLFIALGADRVPLTPVFARKINLRIAGLRLPVTFKEIETEVELDGYRRLSDYHYRGVAHHGRRIPLIAVVDHPLLPRVIGYVELTSAFIMNKARATLFSAPFELDGKILWKTWDLKAMKTRTNLVVRIARTVVYPELRGLGLSKQLVSQGAEYARQRWHIGGNRPLFMEITADMLKFLPFAERAGMHFIGLTEGNLARIRRDMDYLTGNSQRLTALKKGKVGIVHLQANYAMRIQEILNSGSGRAQKKSSLLRRLEIEEEDVSSKQWDLFHNVLRFPKPTYMMGLTPRADSYVRERVEATHPEGIPSEPRLRLNPLSGPIRIRNLTVSIRTRAVDSQKVRMVQRAFGLDPEKLGYNVISRLNLEIPPGSTTLLVGPSGAGKTLLLEALTGERRIRPGKNGNHVHLEGNIEIPTNSRIGTLRPIRSQRPLVDVLGGKDAARSMFMMNQAGLSEAYLYLRRFEELSAGQKYRAMIARLLDSECNLWIADEFCAALDPITAFLAAQNLRRLAAKSGATLVVAAASWSNFIESLRPDLVVQLMSGREHRVLTGEAFRAKVRTSRAG
jgi:ABC-type phosphate/phosphonate transport system ATPase subunit/GNAT superfamily N-acetyltransferase